MKDTEQWLKGYRYIDKELKILERSEEMPERAEMLLRTKNEIINAIDSVHDPELHALLVMRYIAGMSWEAVSEALYREDVKWTRTAVHRRALTEVEKWRSKNAAKGMRKVQKDHTIRK